MCPGALERHILFSVTERLELTDAELSIWTTNGQVSGQLIRLERSAFFPGGGGQVPDEGTVSWDDGEADVEQVVLDGDDVLVRVGRPIPQSITEFTCSLNAPRRRMIMRTHTAFHVLAAVLGEQGALVTGCNLEPGRGRGDFTSINSEIARRAVERTNLILHEAHEVTVEWLPRRDFEANPDLVRLATDLVPDVDPVRIISIDGVDRQADGGTHVRNTAECGEMVFGKFESKGSRNKRVTFAILP